MPDGSVWGWCWSPSILLLADVALAIPLSRQLEQVFTQNNGNLAAILQDQMVEMVSLTIELAILLILGGLLYWRTHRSLNGVKPSCSKY